MIEKSEANQGLRWGVQLVNKLTFAHKSKAHCRLIPQ